MTELKSKRRSWLIALVVFGLGALLSGAGYASLRRAEEQRLRESNQRRVQNQLAALQNTLRRYEESLDSLRTLFEFSEFVSRSEFRGGASKVLERFPVLQAVEWIPLVAGADRAKVEAMVRAEGFSAFTFRDRVSAAPLRYETSRVADEYVAVLYAEPLATNRPALGFNLLSGVSSPQLAHARATGLTSMSPRVQLLITTDSVPGFGVLLPVFATGNSSGGLAPGAFRGVVLGIFRLDNFLREARSLPGTREMFDLLVIDRTVPETPDTLGLVRFDHTVQLDVPAAPAQFALPEAIHETLSLWGRTWELIYHPNRVRMDAQRTQQPLAVLALGLVASAVLGLFSFARVNRAALIEQQVAERTSELRKAQALLLEEVAGRQRAEADRRQIFERITDAFVALDKDWRYTFVNEKAAQLLDRRAKDLIGKHIWTEFPEGVGQKFHRTYERAMADQQAVFLEEYYPPYDRWFENRIYPSREGLTIYFHDITERRKSEALLSGQKQVLELIATGSPLTETLTALVRVIEAQSPEMLCTVLLLDADGVHVRHGAAPSLPADFARAIDGAAIGPAAGSCGTAAFRREAVVVEDIATDPLWAEWRALALPHGLRACWSTPVFDAKKKVLGTFAIYYRQPGRPTAPHQRLTEIATQTAAIAIEREHALAALRLSESRHRRLVESNIIGVMIANTDGRIAEANDLFLGMVGYTREELQTGRVRWDTMTPPEWHAVDAHIIAQLQATGVCAPCEKEYFHKDGHRVAILAAVALLEGTPGDCICVIEDLTERKRAEAVVHESEQRLRSILDTMFVFVGLINLDGCIVEVNQAPLAAAGLKRIDVLGRPVWESYWFSFSPALQAQVQQALARAAQGEVAREDYSIRLAAERLITIDCTFAPLRDAAGHVTQIVGSAIDITERKQAEAAMRESEARFRKIFEEGPLGIAMSSFSDGRFVRVNRAFAEMLGYTAEELQRLTFAEVTHPEHRALDGEAVRQLIADQIPHHHTEKRYLKKNGEVIWGERSLTKIRSADGQSIYALAMIQDITQRKQGEQKLGESREQLRALLARLQRAREEERIRMSREVHDELGQLLTGLKMDVRWLERKLSDPNLPAGLLPLLDRAVAASEMADATIATVQKIAAELRPAALDQLGLAASLAQEARRFQERSGVHCTVAAEAWPVLPREVVGELFYICREALTNVSRHAHAKNVVISLAGDGDSAVLEVCDDGGGIRETDLGAPRSLGLLGMKERAVQCGGTVTFARNEPGGTRVTVRMPLVGPVSTEGGGT